jgi:hypothetical protein
MDVIASSISHLTIKTSKTFLLIKELRCDLKIQQTSLAGFESRKSSSNQCWIYSTIQLWKNTPVTFLSSRQSLLFQLLNLSLYFKVFLDFFHHLVLCSPQRQSPRKKTSLNSSTVLKRWMDFKSELDKKRADSIDRNNLFKALTRKRIMDFL